MYCKTIMAGRLCADPELKYTKTGTALCNLRLAVDRPFKNKEMDTREADFFDLVCWRERAEFVANHLAKGAAILVECRPQNRSWEKPDGSKGYATDFHVDNVQVLIWPKNGDSTPSAEAETTEGGDADDFAG